MNILLLAGGFGTRLKAYGEKTPKGLIPRGKSTLVGDLIDEVIALRSATALVTNARFASTYRKWLEANELSSQIQLLSNQAKNPDERLGALGDIVFALEHFNWWGDDLLVLSTDTYHEFSMRDFVEFSQEKASFSTVVRKLSKEVIAGRLGCAVMNDDRIIEFIEKPEKPTSVFAAIPFYYYTKKTLSLLPDYKKDGGNMDAPGSIIPWFISRGVDVFGYITDGETLDVGTTEDVKALGAIK